MSIIHCFFGGSENWRKNWLRYLIYIGLSILIIVSFLVGGFGKMINKNQNIYYLLSSISQGLATVFVLIVTMRLLIVTSILPTENKNTAIDKLIRISPSELTFYVFFVVTIALPLWLLYRNYVCSCLVQLSLAFAIICFIGIINSAFSFIGIIRDVRKSS